MGEAVKADFIVRSLKAIPNPITSFVPKIRKTNLNPDQKAVGSFPFPFSSRSFKLALLNIILYTSEATTSTSEHTNNIYYANNIYTGINRYLK